MAMEVITSISSDPIVQVLSQTIDAFIETIGAAQNVFIEKEIFAELSTYFERIIPLLKELSRKKTRNYEGLNSFIGILNREIKVAKQLTAECSNRNKVYLLVNCRSIVKRLEGITREMSRALSLIPLASLDISSSIAEDVRLLCDNMRVVEFKAAIAEEEILEKIESGIHERNVDRSYANSLIASIAEAVGISTKRSELKKEFEEFKSEIENAQLRKDQAEAIQMDQIIALLERADATSSLKEKEIKYFTKRNSLGSQPLEPLQSFICPITREVMEDPVETSSGHTFERSAIEKWFEDGHNMCPLTMTPLDASRLRANKTLRQSIEEWRDRNTIITIAALKPKLLSEDEEEVLDRLGQVQDLCEQRDLHREWVVLENYVSTLINLLGSKNREIRSQALVILNILAKDSDDTKERIANVDDAFESIVRSLGRRIGESKLAVALLLELSKGESVRDYIGKVQGCIFLLVTMSSSDDIQAAGDARELLENLSFSHQNVIQMAKANYFRHLLQCLSSGPEDVKMMMATTLAELELTDHNKSSLLEEGVLNSLFHLVSDGDIEMKKVAAKVIQNLSSLPKNGQQIIREGALGLLLDILYRYSSFLSLREQVATTIMHLAISTTFQDSSETQVSLLESDEDIFKLFSLVNLTGPNVQQSLLRAFHAMCQSPSATNIRSKLTQCSAVQVLIQLCEHNNLEVRANAVKLFCCLIEDGDDSSILEHMGQETIETLLGILKTSNDDEEIASVLGVISSLPESPEITKWLLDAGSLAIIIRFLTEVNPNCLPRNRLIENAVGAMCHFTVMTNEQSQKKAAKAGVIPVLVQLLDLGTDLTKRRAALSLAQFSVSSPVLSQSIPKRNGFWCFSAPRETGCSVHRGICSVESSFCLVEAGAVEPLVELLREPDHDACEASLDALLTLIEGEMLQSGSKVLGEANAIHPIIKLLSSPSPRMQEKVLLCLERIFRLLEFQQKYGNLAQMPLVDLTQRGNSRVKSLAAKILAHLNVLHEQSSYF